MREELQFFLPLFINAKHGSRMPKEFMSNCCKILGKQKFTSDLVLQVILFSVLIRRFKVVPKLLNSTVVTFMNGSTHTSERALEGYFLFHQLFVSLIKQFPELQTAVNTAVKKFIQDPQARLKKNTPNVGEWLTYLSVSNEFTWKDASSAYLQENFERNVMWYLRDGGWFV